jgi:hypothetical protein
MGEYVAASSYQVFFLLGWLICLRFLTSGAHVLYVRCAPASKIPSRLTHPSEKITLKPPVPIRFFFIFIMLGGLLENVALAPVT